MRKRKIMSSAPAYDERMDERFEANIPDVFELYLNTSRDVAYCKVDDFRMIGPNIALATIYVVSPERHWQMNKDIIRNLDRYVHDLFEGTDYGADAISVEPSNSVITDEVLRANDLDYDYDEDYDYGEYIAQVEVWSTEHDDFADDAYFNASRKIGRKPIKSSKYVRCTSSSYDTKLIAKYLKEMFDRDASGRGMGSFGSISDAEKYMNRNNLSYDSRNKVVVYRDPRTKETTTIFKVTPQYSNTKRNGMYAPKTPILEPVDSCDSVMSSYNPYGTDFKWKEERIVLYYDGENHNLPKYTGNYEDNTVVIQPEYYERADMLVWFVYLNNKKLEGFETSYDALDFAQFELVDMYITPIRSSKRVPKRKIVSAIDLRRKQDFVDAYMDAYGVTKTEAFKAFKDCVNRGDESYIDEIISGFKGNSRKSFYED